MVKIFELTRTSQQNIYKFASSRAGVQIALDDFGMGYAGLHQLQQMKALPVDILKIDKVFIDMLPEDVSMVPA
ncbi:EAL domain-containing protein, partial [Klebsiella pneumoniae]|uniref:EAL domain-containing protein n=1 Tax=Klebsiella pneumoniae TaxID=573 RepID=UPI003EB9BE0E